MDFSDKIEHRKILSYQVEKQTFWHWTNSIWMYSEIQVKALF